MIAERRAPRPRGREEFIKLFMDDVWKPFADAGMPDERWDELAESVEHVRPLAAPGPARRLPAHDGRRGRGDLHRPRAAAGQEQTLRKLLRRGLAAAAPDARPADARARRASRSRSRRRSSSPRCPRSRRSSTPATSAVSWVLTGFLLSASIATPIVGKLGDLYGKGRVLTVVLVLFCARRGDQRARADDRGADRRARAAGRRRRRVPARVRDRPRHVPARPGRRAAWRSSARSSASAAASGCRCRA